MTGGTPISGNLYMFGRKNPVMTVATELYELLKFTQTKEDRTVASNMKQPLWLYAI